MQEDIHWGGCNYEYENDGKDFNSVDGHGSRQSCPGGDPEGELWYRRNDHEGAGERQTFRYNSGHGDL